MFPLPKSLVISNIWLLSHYFLWLIVRILFWSWEESWGFWMQWGEAMHWVGFYFAKHRNNLLSKKWGRKSWYNCIFQSFFIFWTYHCIIMSSNEFSVSSVVTGCKQDRNFMLVYTSELVLSVYESLRWASSSLTANLFLKDSDNKKGQMEQCTELCSPP